jgi:hypothetical protein
VTFNASVHLFGIQALHKLDEDEKALMASYESLDYEVVRNDVFIRRTKQV